MAALVWFVDRSPRSRKPVQYKLLEDFISSGTKDGLLPVLLPCALCTSQQQMTASVFANDLYGKRKKSQVHKIDDGVRQITEGNGVNVKKSSSPDLAHYNEFVKLCKHVELLLEKSRAKLVSPAEEEKAATKEIQVDDDDFWHRSLKDANRNPSNPFDTNGFLASFSTTENHYVWRTTPILRYRSHFNPMRQHDLVRDDLAVRKLNNKAATAVAEKPARPNSLEDPISRKPPPHPNPPRKRPHSLPPNRRVAGHLRYHHRQSH